MHETRTIRVVAAVIMSGNRFLVCRRAAGKSAAGQWEFPGGKVEDGEDGPAALRREIAEELGVPVRPGRLLVRSSTLVGDRVIDLECRWATLLGRRPHSSADHDELCWATRGELAKFDWCTPDHDAVAVLVNGARP